MDAASDGIFLIEPPTARIVRVNTAGARRLGYSPTDLVGRRVPEIDRALAEPKAWQTFSEKTLLEGTSVVNGQHVAHDGALVPVEVVVDVVERPKTGSRPLFLAVARDRSLPGELPGLRAVADADPHPVIEVAGGSGVTYRNAACLAWFPDLRSGDIAHPLVAWAADAARRARRSGSPTLTGRVQVGGVEYEATVAPLVGQGRFRVYVLRVTGLPEGWARWSDDDDILTDAQKDALEAAVDTGYYDMPRGIGLRELADEMGISSSALSERLRRAEARLVDAYLDRPSREG